MKDCIDDTLRVPKGFVKLLERITTCIYIRPYEFGIPFIYTNQATRTVMLWAASHDQPHLAVTLFKNHTKRMAPSIESVPELVTHSRSYVARSIETTSCPFRAS